jgi:hypothetical protein
MSDFTITDKRGQPDEPEIVNPVPEPEPDKVDNAAPVILHEWNKPTPEWVTKSLDKFGKNAYGENVYRIIWSESRFYTLGGRFSDGFVGYRQVPMYSVQAWILEKYLSPKEFAGSRERWERDMRDEETGLLVLGEYPARGEFDTCLVLKDEQGPIELCIEVIEDLCRMIELSRPLTMCQRKAAMMRQQELRERAWASRNEAIFRDAQQAFDNKASSINPAKRTAEKVDFKYSEDDLRRMIGAPRPHSGFKQIN